MELVRENGVLVVTQRKFAMEMLSEFNCTGLRPVSTLLDPNFKLSSFRGTPHLDPLMYRRLLGKLNFLKNTQPDLCFAVQTLS